MKGQKNYISEINILRMIVVSIVVIIMVISIIMVLIALVNAFTSTSQTINYKIEYSCQNIEKMITLNVIPNNQIKEIIIYKSKISRFFDVNDTKYYYWIDYKRYYANNCLIKN